MHEMNANLYYICIYINRIIAQLHFVQYKNIYMYI
jgi:hypothetical protein